MIRTLTLAAAAAAVLATAPAQAIEFGNMSEAERADFHAAIREYLLENPEVLMEAIAVLEAREAEEAEAAALTMVGDNADAIFNDGHSFVGGNPEGDLTVVEFVDYRCGFCRRAHPEVAELVSSDGNIRTITKEFPILGDESVEASRFAISTLQNAGPEAYKMVSDALITRRGDFSRDALARLAGDLDLDSDTIIAGMDAEAVDAVIAENRALAQRLQISGTPTFVIGDQMVRGYLPLDGMRQVVAEERAE
ncbi:MAG: DsbA family protein [Pseudomonadota bacterium]